MIDSVLIGCNGIGLPYIMEQHCKTQYLVWTDLTHGMQNVLSHRIAMMGMILVRSHADIKFRKNDLRNPRFICNPQIIRMGRGHQLYKLRLNPLCTDILQIRCKHPDSIRRLGFNFISELCRKTYRTHHPQSILRKTFYRIPYAADHPLLKIPRSVKRIHQSLFVVVGHGVNGEIPPFQIFNQI